MQERYRGWLGALGAMTRSLRFKMTVGVASFIVMVSVLLSTLFVVYLESSQADASRRVAEETTRVVAATIADAARAGDRDAVGVGLDAFLQDRRVLYLIAHLPGGNVVRVHESCPESLFPRPDAEPPRGLPRSVPSRPGEESFLEITVPLAGPFGDAGVAGELRAGYSFLAAGRQVEELRWRVATITLAMILMGVAGSMFLVSRVIGPIHDLAAGTERIADGDLQVRVPEESDDEVGVLARSFNRMTERLRSAMDVERALSRDLEQRVREKTREIAETREHLANIVDNVGASILVADLDGTVISANMHTMQIFGTKPEFTVGRRLEEFSCLPELRVDRLLEELERSGAPRVYDARFQRDDRHEMDLLITHTLLRDGQGRAAGFLQITKDITELRRMERWLISSERLSAMGEMAGEIGHELNNYLMAIGGRTELIIAALERGAGSHQQLEKARRSAAIIADQVADMRQLTDGLLDSARKETSLSDVDLNQLVRSTVDFVQPQNRFDRIRVTLDVPDEPLPVRIDRQQIRQVLLNLLTNAADATLEHDPGGGELRVATFRNARETGFLVQDRGVGIDERTRARLFEPHFTTKARGNGFGLAVCHRVVDNHGGRISVEAAPGQGATFTVRLPPNVAATPSAAEPANP